MREYLNTKRPKKLNKRHKIVKVRLTTKEVERALLEDKDWVYYKKVQAHRMYLYSLSLFRSLKDEGKQGSWYKIDQMFIKTIELYN